MNHAVRVGWLGAGVMGAPMARNVRAAGHQVTIWNRTAAKAEPLAEHGLWVAGSAAEAAEGCDLLVTMLADADAVVASLNGGSDGAVVLDRLGHDAVWVQMSTVGVEGCSRLAALARDHGVDFVDAPVSGTLQPAQAGELAVLAAGPAAVRPRCAPVLEAVGSSTTWFDTVGTASSLKLVLNTWLLGLLSALADAVRLAELVGVDPATFLDIIDGGPLGAPYAQLKGQAMVARDYPVAFPLAMAAKDAELVRAAVLRRAVDAGHGDADMAAVVEVLRDS